MAPPKERKRRFHRRSKLGCQTCKRRHVRCDEQKPLCTNCLQTGSECIYPSPEQALTSNTPSANASIAGASTNAVASGSNSPNLELQAHQPHTLAQSESGLNSVLNAYVGGSFEDLPEASKRLLRHFSQYSVWGQRPRLRDIESSTIQRAFENPGYMHMCLMLSACQWAWVTGSMDTVRIPFLYHKASTYHFAREQLCRAETAHNGDTMLAIAALALTEGAVGELHSSSQHLRGVSAALRSAPGPAQGASLPQKMLKMVGEGLRTGRTGRLINVPEYQPTFMALLFASIWDISALPPREAPRYGWWEETDTQAARLWQNHTQDLNLDYEISRGFNPNQFVPRILNGDPKSSRTSFIATFFYLCGEIGHRMFNVALIDWLLEQLIDDVSTGEEYLRSSTWSQPLWLWCVMFGAALASSGRPTTVPEQRTLQRWREVYNENIKLVSRVLGIDSWHSARTVLVEVVGMIDEEADRALEELWYSAVASGGFTQHTIDPAVIELPEGL